MFTKIIRDFKILRNHKKRVNSIIVRSNEEIVRALDSTKLEYLKAERMGDKESFIKNKAANEILRWITNAI
jgi:hypothetical protein